MTPRITVAITAHLRTQYLRRAIESVMNQESEFGFEVILTLARTDFEIPNALLRTLDERSIPFRFVPIDTSTNYGQAISAIARLASGNIVAMLDDDDTWLPGKIARIERVIDQHPRVAYFHCGQDFIDASDHRLSPLNPNRLVRHPSSLARSGNSHVVDAWNAAAFNSSLRFEPGFNNSSIAISKSLLLDAASQLSEVRGGEDGFLFLLGAARGRYLYVTTDHLTGFRIHSSNSALSPSRMGATETAEALALRYRQYVEDRRLLDQARVLRALLPTNAPEHLRAWIDRDHAIRSSLFAAAGGELPGGLKAPTLRALLDSDALSVGVREVLCAALLMGVAYARHPTLHLFMASRKLG